MARLTANPRRLILYETPEEQVILVSMKYWLIFICLLIASCSEFQFNNMSNHLLIQSRNKQFSCLSGASNGGSNCCYPYKNKLMICTYAAVNGAGDETGAVVIRFVPDNTGK